MRVRNVLRGNEKGTHLALIKAHGAFAKNSFVDRNATSNMFTLGFFVHILVVDPSVTVTRYFPVGLFTQGVAHDGIAFQGHADGKNCHGHFALGKETVQTPKAGTSSVVIESLHVDMTLIIWENEVESE
jgi:hypothetical protein